MRAGRFHRLSGLRWAKARGQALRFSLQFLSWKRKLELDGAHWRLFYCLLFCNADWGCHVEKGYHSFLKHLKNPAGNRKNVWMPSVFASGLFRHKRYTQSLPQCDKAIIKKAPFWCAQWFLYILCSHILLFFFSFAGCWHRLKAHPHPCFVQRNDAFYHRVEERKVPACSLHVNAY